MRKLWVSISRLNAIAFIGLSIVSNAYADQVTLPTVPTAPNGWSKTDNPASKVESLGSDWTVPIPYTSQHPACGLGDHWDSELEVCVANPPILPSNNVAGAVGANRVIKSPTGYLSAYGTFSEPDFGGGWKTVTPEGDVIWDGDVVDDLPYNGETIPGSNPDRNKPTLYLGAEGGTVKIDSGLQYEPEPNSGHDAGWWLYERISNSRYPGVWVWKPRWLAARQELGSVTLSISVKSVGKVGTIIDPVADNPNREVLLADVEDGELSTGFYQPYWPNVTENALQSTEPDAYQVRRVIGLTQGWTTMDGAWMRNATSSDGHVAKVHNDQNRLKLDEAVSWPPTNAYEYGPITPNGDPNETSFQTMDYPWVVDFGAPFTRLRDKLGTHPRDANPQIAHTQEAVRYITETVNINMLKNPPGTWVPQSKKIGKRLIYSPNPAAQ